MCHDGRVSLAPAEFDDWLTPAVVEAMTLADLWEKGSPPVAGGTLDQSASMVEAALFIWNEHAQNKAHLERQAMRDIDG